VERYPALTGTLDRWSADPDFWLRRSALLALLVPLRRGAGEFERFSRYADQMLDEREFFIRKAIGWVLRETGKRRPDLVAGWLAPRIGRVSGVTVREAVKPLPPSATSSWPPAVPAGPPPAGAPPARRADQPAAGAAAPVSGRGGALPRHGGSGPWPPRWR
jgi:DNA alkylation repair enzyme